MQQLRGYKGERYDLGQAEQFLLLLTDLPDYRTLLTGLLFKVEFGPRYQKLKNAFSAMTKAARDILHHQGLKDFLFLLLDSGNYLNQVREQFNINGFEFLKVDTLLNMLTI